MSRCEEEAMAAGLVGGIRMTGEDVAEGCERVGVVGRRTPETSAGRQLRWVLRLGRLSLGGSEVGDTDALDGHL